MSEYMKFVDPGPVVSSFYNLSELYSNGEMIDIVLLTNDSSLEIKAHKVILAAASSYFRAMFVSGFSEAEKEKILLCGIEYSALKDAINFIYNRNITISEDNVFGLMNAADLLQLPGIRKACYHFLSSNINLSNCLLIYAHAKKHCYVDLSERSFRYILKNFNDLIDQEQFYEAPLDILTSIFSSRFVSVPNEDRLLEALVQWVKHPESDRKKHVCSLLNLLDLNQVSVEALESLRNDENITNSALYFKISCAISDLLLRTYSDNVMSDETEVTRTPRHTHEYEAVLCVGGKTGDLILNTIYVLVAEKICEDTKLLAIPNMKHQRMYMGVTSRNHKVFVIGGCNRELSLFDSVEYCYTDSSLWSYLDPFLCDCNQELSLLDSVECYSTDSNSWSDLHPLPIKLCGCVALFNEGLLYVLGGCTSDGTTDKVWVYEENRNCWRDGVSMLHPRAFHGGVSVSGLLYVLGGIISGDHFINDLDKSDTYIDKMERYDPHMGLWYQLPPMRSAMCKFGTTAFKECIYVLGGTVGASDGWTLANSVEKYNTLTNQWCSIYPFRGYIYTATMFGNCICCGGVHDDHIGEMFDPLTNKWERIDCWKTRQHECGLVAVNVSDMKVTRLGCGLVTVNVPDKVKLSQ